VRLNAFSSLLEDEPRPTLEHERLRKRFEDDIKSNLAGYLSKCQVRSMTRYVENTCLVVETVSHVDECLPDCFVKTQGNSLRANW